MIIITVAAVVIHHDHAMMMTIVITSASMAIMNADDEAHDDDEVQPKGLARAIPGKEVKIYYLNGVGTILNGNVAPDGCWSCHQGSFREDF